MRDGGVFRLISLLWLAGCGPAPFHYRLHEHARGPEVVFAGTAVRLELFVTTPGENARDTSNPSTLRCSVTAPSGTSVECVATRWVRPSLDEDNGTAKLSFTPSESGWHDVMATVAEGGEFRWRLYALEKRGEVITTLDRRCGWLDRFADGAWLCDGVFLREGELAQPLHVELTALSGDFVWTFASGRLARLREPLAGQSFTLPGQTFDTGLGTITALLATPDEVLVVHRQGVLRIALDGTGALAQTATRSTSFADQSVARRLGDVLLVGSTLVPFVVGTDPAAPPDAQSEVCTFTITHSEFSPVACRRYPGQVRGEVEGGVLLGPATRLRAVSVDLDDGVELALPTPLAAVPFTARGLAMLPTGVIPRLSEGTLRLESWAGATAASEQFVWSAQAMTAVMNRQ